MKGPQNHYDESDFEDDDDFSSSEGKTESRVILLMDLDCYEIQVLLKTQRPDLIGRDIPIVAVNHDNIILAVNYTAKRLGISRTTTTGQNALKAAKEICEEKGIELTELKTATRFGKSDSFLPMLESDKILSIIQEFQSVYPSITIQRDSKDEFYLDVTAAVTDRMKNMEPRAFSKEVYKLTSTLKKRTDPTYKKNKIVMMETSRTKSAGDNLNYRILQVYLKPSEPSYRAYHQDELRLVHGSIIAMDITMKIWEKLDYIVSTGVSYNKLLAKIACGRNKPEGIAILTAMGFERLTRQQLRITDLSGYAGVEGQKLAAALKAQYNKTTLLSIQKMTMFKLQKLIKDEVPKLAQGCPDTLALDLKKKCNGADDSPVLPRVHNDTISVSTSIKPWGLQEHSLEHYVELLSLDVADRLEYFRDTHRRTAKLMTVKIKTKTQETASGDSNSNSNSFNTMDLNTNRIPTAKELQNLVMNYIRHSSIQNHNLILKIQLTGSQIIQL